MPPRRISSRLSAFAFGWALLFSGAYDARAQNLVVGSNAVPAVLTLSNGANSYVSTYVGSNSISSNNVLSVLNAGTQLSNSTSLIVGVYGSGNGMTVSNAASAVSTIETIVGYASTGNSLDLAPGSSFASGTGFVGHGTNASNNTVSLVAANMSCTNALLVGNYGSGNALSVSGGGACAAPLNYLGGWGGSAANSVLVSDPGSQFSSSTALMVGNYGHSNRLIISNGAACNAAVTHIGGWEGASNNGVFVTGAGSQLVTAASLYVGNAGGRNAIVVADGAASYSATTCIGRSATSLSNTAVIYGVESGLYSSSALIVGKAGGGSLTVFSGGIVAAPAVTVASVLGSAGTIHVGRPGTNDAAGYISASSVSFGAGSGAFQFNQNDSFVLDASISGPGTLVQAGSGTTTLSAANSYSGPTTISRGMLVIEGNQSGATNATLVSAGAFLAGSGTVGGRVDLAGGTISPGGANVPSSLTVRGIVSVPSGSQLLFRVAGNGTNASLVASAGASVNGGVGIVLEGGYAPAAGDTFHVLTGTVSGTPSFSNLPPLAPGLAWVTKNFVSAGVLSVISTNKDLIVGDSVVPTNTFLTSGTNLYEHTYVGSNSVASNNLLQILNAGTLLTNSMEVYVGLDGADNAMFVADGAGAGTATNTYIGYNSRGNSMSVGGGATAAVPPSAFASANLAVGYYGSSNTLGIWNGVVSVSSNTVVGYGAAASNNAAQISGSGSLLTNQGAICVGFEGVSNSLSVALAGSSISSYAVIGSAGTASNNNVHVSDAGSLLLSSGDLDVGDGGSGNRLAVLSGGKASAQNTTVGFSNSATGNSISVVGSATAPIVASLLTNSSSLYVGYYGSSNSVFLSGAAVSAAQSTYVGYASGAVSNTVFADGTGTLLTNASELHIGFLGSSNGLGVTGGAVCAAGSASIGDGAGASGNNATVFGTGSLLTNASILRVGNAGNHNALTVMGGGAAAALSVFVGLTNSAANNSISINGSNSLLSASSSVIVGYYGANNGMFISGGGKMSSASTWVGIYSSSNGVTVTGTNSVLTNSATLYVGQAGSWNHLSVEAGATAAAGAIYAGFTNGASNNSISVSGSGSALRCAGSIYAGLGGGGFVAVYDGGMLVASNIVIAANPGSTGALDIGRFNTNDAGGIIDAISIFLGQGFASLNFNQTNIAVVGANISGPGNVNQFGLGGTVLSGSNSYSGSTIVSRGTLAINGNQSAATNAVTVSSGGQLTGSGTIGGPVTVNSNATLLPGWSASAPNLVVYGPVNAGPGSAVTFRVQGKGTNCTLVALGLVMLGGEVRVQVDPSYAPAAGDSFHLISGYISGAPSLNLPPLSAGLAWVTNTFLATGTVSVASGTNAPLVYTNWTTNYPTLTGTNADMSADPDGDGWNNFTEYAFDGNPTQGTGALFQSVVRDTNVVFTFVANNGLFPASYVVQSSPDLIANAWTNNPAITATISNSPDQSGILLNTSYTRKQFVVPLTLVEYFRVQAVGP